MTPRCDICGDFESENTTIEPGYGACQDCIHRLIENEIERRADLAKTFAALREIGASRPARGF